jgi:hypothetical protein
MLHIDGREENVILLIGVFAFIALWHLVACAESIIKPR